MKPLPCQAVGEEPHAWERVSEIPSQLRDRHLRRVERIEVRRLVVDEKQPQQLERLVVGHGVSCGSLTIEKVTHSAFRMERARG